MRPAQCLFGCGLLARDLRCLEGEREVVGKGRKQVDLLLVEVVGGVGVERDDADGAPAILQREGGRGKEAAPHLFGPPGTHHGVVGGVVVDEGATLAHGDACRSAALGDVVAQ